MGSHFFDLEPLVSDRKANSFESTFPQIQLIYFNSSQEVNTFFLLKLFKEQKRFQEFGIRIFELHFSFVFLVKKQIWVLISLKVQLPNNFGFPDFLFGVNCNSVLVEAIESIISENWAYLCGKGWYFFKILRALEEI